MFYQHKVIQRLLRYLSINSFPSNHTPLHSFLVLHHTLFTLLDEIIIVVGKCNLLVGLTRSGRCDFNSHNRTWLFCLGRRFRRLALLDALLKLVIDELLDLGHLFAQPSVRGPQSPDRFVGLFQLCHQLRDHYDRLVRGQGGHINVTGVPDGPFAGLFPQPLPLDLGRWVLVVQLLARLGDFDLPIGNNVKFLVVRGVANTVNKDRRNRTGQQFPLVVRNDKAVTVEVLRAKPHRFVIYRLRIEVAHIWDGIEPLEPAFRIPWEAVLGHQSVRAQIPLVEIDSTRRNEALHVCVYLAQNKNNRVCFLFIACFRISNCHYDVSQKWQFEKSADDKLFVSFTLSPSAVIFLFHSFMYSVWQSCCKMYFQTN
uniref:(northern house mosquito) hypothetical protein n=1 Tax=Culex pipiens TaxID=7175 RepID=A0A8D8GMU9_CULPI